MAQEETEPRAERRLVAILAADIAGYSRFMGIDEEGTLQALKGHRKALVDPSIKAHHGRIVKTTGDGMLVEFASAVDAVRCAVAVQRGMIGRNADVAADRRIEFRVGINVGDIIAEDGDIYGDGVNVAARLESMSKPGGICVSRHVRDTVRDKLAVSFEDMGEQILKNIARPVRAYRVNLADVETYATPPTSAVSVLALPDKPSLAVLPFQNISGDPEQEYFADGIVEEIITALSRFRQLFVIARNSSFTYKGRAVDVKQVGRELGVRYVLEGSVRKASGLVRISGQLIDTGTAAHLWADHFDGGLEDIFELQDQITASVVGAIAPKVEQAEIERAKRKPTDSLDAYDCFLRGMASYHQYVDRYVPALRLFNQAFDLDPNFASAYAMAASCYVIRKASAWRTDPAHETAEAVRLARRSLELGKDDALVLAVSGGILAHMTCDLDVGAALTDRALALNSNLAAAWFYSGYIRLWLGEPNAAIERFARALRISPLDSFLPRMQNGMANALFYAGRYDEASSFASRVLSEIPDFHDALRTAAASNALAGRQEQAQQAIKRLRQIDPVLRVSTLGEVQGPYRRAEDIARYEEAMRKAGLPE